MGKRFRYKRRGGYFSTGYLRPAYSGSYSAVCSSADYFSSYFLVGHITGNYSGHFSGFSSVPPPRAWYRLTMPWRMEKRSETAVRRADRRVCWAVRTSR